MRARLYLLAAWLYNVAVAVDQLVNALRGGAADSTVSADAWHAWEERRIWGLIARPLIDGLFYCWERDHCRRAWELDPTERRNAPKHMARRALEGGEWVI